MWLRLTLLLLFVELCTLQGHVISKREATDVDKYIVKADKDTIEIINPKAKKPTLREIIFYHVIEKPYPDSHQTIIIDNDVMISNKKMIVNDDNKVQINDSPRPWTNGHGFQYLNENNLTDGDEADNAESSESRGPVDNGIAPTPDVKNDELPDDEQQNAINDDTSEKQGSKNDQGNDKDLKKVKNDNDLKEENQRPVQNGRPSIKNNVTDADKKADDEDLLDDEELPKEDPLNNYKIADIGKIEEDKTIRFRDFITENEKPGRTRRRRDIDYSKLHDAPALPLFKIDRFPDYIKDILPSDDDLQIPKITEKPAFLSRSTEKPAYLSWSTEKPAYLSRTTEESVYLTEKPEVARKPVHLSRTTENPERFMPKISIRIGESEKHKIIKKSPRNVDEEIEKEISEVIRNVAEAQDMNTEVEIPSSGMNLIGDNGVVWNDLHGQHYRFNVGPDASNTEDHNAQIPYKPSTVKPDGTTEKDASTIDLSSEIEAAFEEIGHIFEEILDQTEKENTETDKATTENYDVHVNINKDRVKHEKFEENNKKPFEQEESKFDENKEIYNDKEQSNGHVKAKTVENDQDNLEQVMDFLNVIQKLVENSKKNESEDLVNDKVIEPRKESNKVNSESDEKLEKKSDSTDAIEDLLNNKNYWGWLKDTSESYMNIIMKRVLGLIKEEVAKQIQQLVFKMMEEQGVSPPDEHNDRDKKDSDITRHKDKKGSKGQTLKADDKYWDWLKDSSEAYINILMKRLLGEIADGVANQIDILATRMFKENGYTPPKKDKKNKKDTDNGENSEVIKTLKGNSKWKWLTKASDSYLDKTMKRVNKLIEEEVTRQVTHLVKYHMPSNNDDEQTKTDEDSNKKDENSTTNDKNDINSDDNNDSNSKSDEKQLDESKDEIIDKKCIDKKKHKHDHENEDKNKHKHDGKEHKSKDTKQAKKVKISAKNTYGTSINNEKVTNIFVFALDGRDLKNLKPISSGNGIFIFGTDNNDKDSDKQITEPSKITDNSSTDSKPNDDEVEITTVKEEEVIDNTDSDINKEDKDSSNEKENLDNSNENSENPEKNLENQVESSDNPEDNSDNPEENSEKSEDSSEKSEENPKSSSEDSEKSEKDSENEDSKDTPNKTKNPKDEIIVEIDERIGEIDELKDKKIIDSSENLKDKESDETAIESSSDKSSE